MVCNAEKCLKIKKNFLEQRLYVYVVNLSLKVPTFVVHCALRLSLVQEVFGLNPMWSRNVVFIHIYKIKLVFIYNIIGV